MAIKIQLRRGTAAEWTSANPVLMQGEMGVETDTLKVKIGNGTTAWTTLPYFTQGAKGDKGDQGIQGIQGVQGNTGPVGPVGPANTLSVGSVTTGIEGSDAEVTITGTAPNQTMSLKIPRGNKGDAATITVGTVTQVAAGQPAKVTNAGTSAAAVLNFEIPNAVGVPTGGTAGQIVRKTASGTEWADMPPSQLSGQTDVSISSPQNKQVLKYDGSKWVNATASGGVTVSESSPADPSNGDGWFFAADGTQFVRYDDGTSVQWVQPNAVLSSQVEQRYYSPNYIINGGPDIWQRGTSVTVSSGYGYGPDRWRGYSYTANSFTMSQQTFTPGTAPVAELAYFLRFRNSSTRAFAETLIEDVRTLSGKTATLSFWAKAPAGTTLTAHVFQNFGSGGSAVVTDIVRADSSLSTSWQRFSRTFVMPSLAGKTIGSGSYIGVELTSQSLNTDIDICGVQLEEGSTATAFRRNANSLQGELAACQRYYYRTTSTMAYGPFGHGYGYSTTGCEIYVNLPVQMRTAPVSVETSSPSSFFIADGVSGVTATSITLFTSDHSPNTVGLNVQRSSGGIVTYRPYAVLASNNVSSYIGFSAEL